MHRVNSSSQIQSVLPSATEINGYTSIQAAILLAKQNSDAGKSTKIKLPAGTIDVDASKVSSTRAFVVEGRVEQVIELLRLDAADRGLFVDESFVDEVASDLQRGVGPRCIFLLGFRKDNGNVLSLR